MEYKVVTVTSASWSGTNFERAAEELARLVNEQIAAGWKPQGGVAVGGSQMTHEPFLFQALIKA